MFNCSIFTIRRTRFISRLQSKLEEALYEPWSCVFLNRGVHLHASPRTVSHDIGSASRTGTATTGFEWQNAPQIGCCGPPGQKGNGYLALRKHALVASAGPRSKKRLLVNPSLSIRKGKRLPRVGRAVPSPLHGLGWPTEHPRQPAARSRSCARWGLVSAHQPCEDHRSGPRKKTHQALGCRPRDAVSGLNSRHLRSCAAATQQPRAGQRNTGESIVGLAPKMILAATTAIHFRPSESRMLPNSLMPVVASTRNRQ